MRDSDNNLDNLNNNDVTEKVVSDTTTEAADNAASAVSENIDNTSEEASESTDEIEIISAHDIPEDELHSEDGNHESTDSTTGTAEPESDTNVTAEQGKIKKKRTTGDIIRYIIMAIAGAVFLFAAVNIGIIVATYIKENNANKAIQASVFESTKEDATTAVVDKNGNTYPNINVSAQIDFAELQAINPKAIGWVSVPAVDVEYPIVQGEDNSYYLSHTFSDEFGWSGSIFLDYRNNPDLTDKHSFIYGHHMNDGSMFTGLLKYDDEEFYKDNQDENYFYIYMEDTVKVFEIVAVSDVNIVDHPQAYSVGIGDDFSNANYMEFIKTVELYDTGIEVTDDDTLVTLFTCQGDSSSNVRHMVHGKLIAELDY